MQGLGQVFVDFQNTCGLIKLVDICSCVICSIPLFQPRNVAEYLNKAEVSTWCSYSALKLAAKEVQRYPIDQSAVQTLMDGFKEI